MNKMIFKSGLGEIYDKVLGDERLSVDDGVKLYKSPNLAAVGFLANIVREKLNGNLAYYIYNQHINHSNICVNCCRFCAFYRRSADQEGAYRMTLDEIKGKIVDRLDEPIQEVHIVGGCDPDLPYSYYIDMLRMIKEVRPAIHIQAFTCVEIAHFASISDKTVDEVLIEMKEAGLGSIPGGGAEIFSARVREKVCKEKLSPEGWLEVSAKAHNIGLKSNATMLYGHVETARERAEHLARLREVQDETSGFMAFIPLAFHPKNTELSDHKGSTGVADLKNIAVARLMLDNFPHIKAFWIMIGPKLAQISLGFGADDMDGTVCEEKITHMAGAETEQVFPVSALRRYIIEAGREPVERDTVYNIIKEQS